jgi:hypothetical protein
MGKEARIRSTALSYLGSTGAARETTGDTAVRAPRGRSRIDTLEPSSNEGAFLSDHESEVDVSPPIPEPLIQIAAIADTRPIQIWEGTVLSIDAHCFHAKLNAKLSQLPEHRATIDFQWVHEQDMDLVRSGAVFYLTLFRRISHGSIENSEELRFRRRPYWSNSQVLRLKEDADALANRMVDGQTPRHD